VAKAYGSFGEKEFNGKKFAGTLRSTVVVDPEGNVRLAEYNVDAKGHVARLRESLGVN
jgi:peroxiredoxin Q/BCP